MLDMKIDYTTTKKDKIVHVRKTTDFILTPDHTDTLILMATVSNFVEFRDIQSVTNREGTIKKSVIYDLEELGFIEPIEEAWHSSYRLNQDGKDFVNKFII